MATAHADDKSSSVGASLLNRLSDQVLYRAIARKEAASSGLPFELADAVMKVESDYVATRVGGVGERGLMQVRPETAAYLGFRGTADELAQPATNIHYGVLYLARAWHLADGDVCRALMKYRAGHGEEVMSPLSTTYCNRAKAYLAAIGSPLASGIVVADLAVPVKGQPKSERRGVRLRGTAFWAAEEARVRSLTAKVHARWQRMAAR